MRSLKKPHLLALAASMLLSTACANYNPLGGTAAVSHSAGWTEATHGKNATPNYDMVFPQDKVSRLDVTIKAADWKLMQENMEKLFGSGQGGPGGPAGGQGGGQGGAFPGGGFPGAPNPSASGSPGTSPAPRPSGSPGAFPSGFPAPDASGSPGAFPGGFPQPGAGFPGGGMGGPGGGGGGLSFSEEDPIYRPCTVSFNGKTWEHVGIRYKGNSSLRSSWGRTLKMPFRFDFDEMEDEFPDAKDQRFYGFKKLTLSSGFTDNSLIREKVVADIFRAAGVPAAKTAFYRLYVDYGEGSKYFGLYTMVEAPDKPMLAQQFKKPGGNLYKPEGNGAKFVTFDEKSFAKKTNENTSDWNDVKAVFSALNASRDDAAKWRAGLEKVFDMEEYLNYLAVNTLIQNWDTYGRMAHNYYLYTDPSDGLMRWIPWDNNMALGGGMGGGGGFGGPGGMQGNFPGAPPANAAANPAASASPAAPASPGAVPTVRPGQQAGGQQRPGGGMGNAFSLELSSSEVGNDWPMIRYIIDDPVYHAKYVAYVDKARKGAFATEPTKQRYQAAHNLISQYVVGAEGEQQEATLLSSQAAFESSLTELNTHLESRQKAAEEFIAKYPQ